MNSARIGKILSFVLLFCDVHLHVYVGNKIQKLQSGPDQSETVTHVVVTTGHTLKRPFEYPDTLILNIKYRL